MLIPKSKYFNEIRWRICFVLFSFVFSFIFSYYFIEEYFNIIAKPIYNISKVLSNIRTPLSSEIPFEQKFIFTQISEAFTTYFHTSLLFVVIINVPFTLYHFWTYSAPGLYLFEKRIFKTIISSNISSKI